MSLVTSNISSIKGAGPFSFASSSASCHPVSASSRLTASVNSIDSCSPYFIFNSISVEPNPRYPIPCRRFRNISVFCSAKGSPLISTTLSSIRVKTRTTSLNLSQSNRAWSENGSTTNFVKLIEPSKQAPYSGKGCSPQGLVARISSQNQLLLNSFTRSMRINPGSA